MKKLLPLILLSFLSIFFSCKNNTETEEATYFGGEIINPKSNYVLLYKDETLIDSIPLDKNNRFLHKFESFVPGLYNFRHDEYQYVYIEPNDSIVLRLNTIEFDESLTFCGKGANKNNFIIKTFLKNEEIERNSFKLYQLPPTEFSNQIDETLEKRLKVLERYQNKYEFSKGFNEIAKAHIVFHSYSQKEMYPTHNRKFTDSININLFYKFRENIDFNNPNLGYFYPYYDYIYSLVDNISFYKTRSILPKNERFKHSLPLYTTKIKVIDSLIPNEEFKNQLFKRTALQYLSKEEDPKDANAFLNEYNKYNTDKSNELKITKLVKAIAQLQKGNTIPNFKVVNTKNDTLTAKNIINKPTVFYFWTTKYPRHLKSVHKKVKKFEAESNYNFIGLSIDDDFNSWKKIVSNLNTNKEYLLVNNKDASENLLIHNVHKIFVLDHEGKILNTTLNLFDVQFGKKLQELK